MSAQLRAPASSTGPGGGSVDSVNGDEGPDVVLDAGDVGAEPSGAVATHSADTTGVHGIADTAALETAAGAAAKVAAEAVLARNADNLNSGTVNDARIPSGVTRDSELAQAIADEVTARNAAISTAINALLDMPPATLDTLNELAAALGDDPNFAATITALIATKVAKADFDANTILKADSDDTPAALTVGEATIVGRLTGGNIAALTASQVRTLLSLVIGTDVQAFNSTLQSLTAASANGVSLVTAVNYAAMRTLLGLGTAALASTGDFDAAGAASAAVGAHEAADPAHPASAILVSPAVSGESNVQDVLEALAAGAGAAGVAPHQEEVANVGLTLTQGTESAALEPVYHEPGPLRFSRYGTLIFGSFALVAPIGFTGESGQPLTFDLPNVLPEVAVDQIIGQGRTSTFAEVVLSCSGRTVTLLQADGTPITTSFVEDAGVEGHFAYFTDNPGNQLEGTLSYTAVVEQGAATLDVTVAEVAADQQRGMTVGHVHIALGPGTVGDAAPVTVDLDLAPATDWLAGTIVGWGLATIGGVAAMVQLVHTAENVVTVCDSELVPVETPLEDGDSIEGWLFSAGYIGVTGVIDNSIVTVMQNEEIPLSGTSAIWARRDRWIVLHVSFTVDSVVTPTGPVEIYVSGLPRAFPTSDAGAGLIVLGGTPVRVAVGPPVEGRLDLTRIDDATGVDDPLQVGDECDIWLLYEVTQLAPWLNAVDATPEAIVDALIAGGLMVPTNG